jgi:hypothetical protein
MWNGRASRPHPAVQENYGIGQKFGAEQVVP